MTTINHVTNQPVSGADAAARVAFAPIEVPVGVFMSFLGAPFFLYLLKKGMRRG